MILWLIALALLAGGGIVGFYQGALRVAFSFVGLLLAAMLADPLGSLFKSIIPIFGLKNPLVVAFLAPSLGFLLVLTLFKCAALVVHKKVGTFYKYKANDTERLLFERLNARVGIAMGLANGFMYLCVLCTLLYSLGYLTVQVATTDNDSWMLRLVNRVSEDVKRTRMAKAVSGFMPRSELYYDAADIVGDIFQTPLLQNRLANYPPLLMLSEQDEFKPLSDPALQTDWIKGMTFGQFINHEKVKPLVENPKILTTVLGMLGGDLKDLKTYMETGKSLKYDDERILGRWAFDFKSSMSRARRLKPNMGSAEITRLRKIMGSVFMNATLIATVDNKAVLKLPSAGSKGVTRGTWKSGADGKYVLNVTENGQKMDLDVVVDGRNLIFTKDSYVLVFENTRV
jgi:hypothetical protein